MKTIEYRKFICADSTDNHNKFWACTLFENDDVKTEWGRVGKKIMSKTFQGKGVVFANRKIKEKIKKGYQEIETIDAIGATSNKASLKEIAKTQIIHSSSIITDLIDYLVTVNQHNINFATGGKISWDEDAGLFTTPVGIVSNNSIIEARKTLDVLRTFVSKKEYKDVNFLKSLERYLVLIPQDIGMKFIPENILPDVEAIQKQNDILDSLESSYLAVSSGTVKGQQKEKVQQVFDVSLDLLEEPGMIREIKSLYSQTRQTKHISHRFTINKVYVVAMPNAITQFENVSKKIGNVQRLWHGTRSANLLSILKQGMVIPPSSAAHCTGRMFGNGVYFSDQSTKALNYAAGYWDGKGSDQRTFMFLADVAMGNSHIPNRGWGSFPIRGYDSTFAKAHVSGIINNEMIVYDTKQCNLKFLVEFK